VRVAVVAVVGATGNLGTGVRIAATPCGAPTCWARSGSSRRSPAWASVLSSTRRRSAPTSPGPKHHAVDESWPTDGIPELDYSWQKAYVERVVDSFERDQRSCRVVRMRPGLVF
jgi:hypothetical protein